MSDPVELDGEKKYLVVEDGTPVADGKHIVPAGVAVEPLENYNGQKKLEKECPDDVRQLLEGKDALEVYQRFVKTVVETGKTRSSVLKEWKDMELVKVIDLFRHEFTAKGIKVAMCKRKSGKGTFRWLEFIDVDNVETEKYVPQFDVANLSGQVIKTIQTTLEFPEGVAVERLQNWGGRKRLKEKIPDEVAKMIEEKDLKAEYSALVDDCVENGVGKHTKDWKSDKLEVVMARNQEVFRAKGVDVFFSFKKEWIWHGSSGHNEFFRWIEFVDREKQPNYYPQRRSDDKEGPKNECVIC